MAWIAAALLTLAMPAWADPPMPPSVKACLVDKVNVQDIIGCYDRETKTLEIKLPAGSQAWKAKRDEKCSAEAEEMPGSSGVVMGPYCIMNRIIEKVHTH